MKKRTFLSLALMMFAAWHVNEGMRGVAQERSTTAAPYTVTDIAGREIAFDKVPERVLALGHGVLQQYAYVCGADRLVGIEETAKSGHSLMGQSVHHAYPELRKIQTVGKGGPKFSPDDEQIAYQAPDVVFIAYENTKEELDELQKKLNVPIVGIGAGMRGAIFGDDAYRTFEIIGKTMRAEKRAAAVIRFMKSAQEDLRKRVADLPENGETVYIGGCSFRGTQGILSTKSHIDLLTTVRANNVMDNLTESVSVVIDKEKLLDLDPEIIILDLSGEALLAEDMKADPGFYQALKAFRNRKAYAIMPYFTYGMNYDTAILDMYSIGKVVHPDRFADVDLERKGAEIYTAFVGKDVYCELMETYPKSFREAQIDE